MSVVIVVIVVVVVVVVLLQVYCKFIVFFYPLTLTIYDVHRVAETMPPSPSLNGMDIAVNCCCFIVLTIIYFLSSKIGKFKIISNVFI